MVPTAFHHRAALPLTANSKDRTKVLTALPRSSPATALRPRRGGTSRRPARPSSGSRPCSPGARAPVERIADHFDLGGTSSAVKVVIGLDPGGVAGRRPATLSSPTWPPYGRRPGGAACRAAALLLDDPAATGLLVCFPTRAATRSPTGRWPRSCAEAGLPRTRCGALPRARRGRTAPVRPARRRRGAGGRGDHRARPGPGPGHSRAARSCARPRC
ncbi:hypothetical protein HBB16_16665 [Pseudonocardia sp. MCCB 268]|nr:hypothetical protein [Pseudonocardia cytotoxica]